MSKVTLSPYLEYAPDGSDPRIAYPVETPAAFVLVESRQRGRFTSRSGGDGVPIALAVAKQYYRDHRRKLEALYVKLDAAAAS